MTRPLSASAAASAPPPLYNVDAESDFIIVLAALLCALISVVGIIAILRCTWLRQTPTDTGNIPPPCSSAANKGVKKKVLQSLPKFTYAASSSPSTSSGPVSKFSPECSICLSEFEEGDELRVLPACGHGFHAACIDTWLVSRSSCPSCRQVIVVGQCRKCGRPPMAHRDAEVELKERQLELAQLGNRNNIDVGFLP